MRDEPLMTAAIDEALPQLALPGIAVAVTAILLCAGLMMRWRKTDAITADECVISGEGVAVVASVRHRRSIFPRDYFFRETKEGARVPAVEVERSVVESLLEAASWAPFHGSVPPWKFVVLGRRSMVRMQELTLEYYDKHWREVGWAAMPSPVERCLDPSLAGKPPRGRDGKPLEEAAYRRWRAATEAEIEGRWGPCSFMVAVVMRRQAGSRRVSEWEEAAATACAVQNMWIQACEAFPGLACYWSSWHEAARDSREMAAFLGTDFSAGDRCFGFFVVATVDPAKPPPPDRRRPRWTPPSSSGRTPVAAESDTNDDATAAAMVEWRD